MRLRFNWASPFARKVRVVAREAGVAARIEEIETMVSPVDPNRDLARENPLVKIPSLVTDDGLVLYDSRVICEYLDALGGGRLFPATGNARWNTLRLHALCDGILDAGVSTRYETFVRPEAIRWPDWVAGQRVKIDQGLDALEAEAPTWGQDFLIGHVACACVLGYLDFRYGDRPWRPTRPRLAAWYETALARPSIALTQPR